MNIQCFACFEIQNDPLTEKKEPKKDKEFFLAISGKDAIKMYSEINCENVGSEIQLKIKILNL